MSLKPVSQISEARYPTRRAYEKLTKSLQSAAMIASVAFACGCGSERNEPEYIPLPGTPPMTQEESVEPNTDAGTPEGQQKELGDSGVASDDKRDADEPPPLPPGVPPQPKL